MISSLEGVTKGNSANSQSRIQYEGQYNLFYMAPLEAFHCHLRFQ